MGELIFAIIMTLGLIIIVIYHVVTIYNQPPIVCPTSPICMGAPSRMGLNYSAKTDRVDALLIKFQLYMSQLQEQHWCPDIRSAMYKSRKEFVKEMEAIREMDPELFKCSSIRTNLVNLKSQVIKDDVYLAMLDIWNEIENEVCQNETMDLDRLWDMLNDILDSFCPQACK